MPYNTPKVDALEFLHTNSNYLWIPHHNIKEILDIVSCRMLKKLLYNSRNLYRDQSQVGIIFIKLNFELEISLRSFLTFKFVSADWDRKFSFGRTPDVNV